MGLHKLQIRINYASPDLKNVNKPANHQQPTNCMPCHSGIVTTLSKGVDDVNYGMSNLKCFLPHMLWLQYVSIWSWYGRSARIPAVFPLKPYLVSATTSGLGRSGNKDI